MFETSVYAKCKGVCTDIKEKFTFDPYCDLCIPGSLFICISNLQGLLLCHTHYSCGLASSHIHKEGKGQFKALYTCYMSLCMHNKSPQANLAHTQ